MSPARMLLQGLLDRHFRVALRVRDRHVNGEHAPGGHFSLQFARVDAMLALYARSPAALPPIIRALIVHRALTRGKFCPRMEGFWKRMACRFQGGIGHGRPSHPPIVSIVIFIYVVHPVPRSAFSSLPELHSYVNQLLHDPYFPKGQLGARAANPAARQSLLDINGEASLISASTSRLVTSAAALLRSSPHYRFPTILRTNAPMQNGVLEGAPCLRGNDDPAPVQEEAWCQREGCPSRGCTACWAERRCRPAGLAP